MGHCLRGEFSGELHWSGGLSGEPCRCRGCRGAPSRAETQCGRDDPSFPSRLPMAEPLPKTSRDFQGRRGRTWPAIPNGRTFSTEKAPGRGALQALSPSSPRKSPLPPRWATRTRTRPPRLRLAVKEAKSNSVPEGRDPARHRQVPGRRRRGLQGDPIRGLRPGRGRGDRRGDDRQPEPDRVDRALDLRQAWREPRRDGLGQLHVRKEGRDPLPGGRGETRTR